MVPCATITAEGREAHDSRRLARATVRWSSVLLGGVEPVVSDPLDELAANPDVISAGGEDFRAFVVSRWPGLVRLAFGLTGDRWAAEDIAQATLARAYVAWRRVSRADDPDAYLRRILINTSRRRFRRHRVIEQPGGSPCRTSPIPATAASPRSPSTGPTLLRCPPIPGTAPTSPSAPQYAGPGSPGLYPLPLISIQPPGVAGPQTDGLWNQVRAVSTPIRRRDWWPRPGTRSR
jgi:hypothetical protein